MDLQNIPAGLTCQFCHRLIWGHLRHDHRDGLAVWASGQGITIAPIWLAVLLLVSSIAGKTGLGMALPVSVLAANVPQLWVAYQAGNLADISSERTYLKTSCYKEIRA